MTGGLRGAALAVALEMLGVQEQGGSNRGRQVEAFQRAAGIRPGDPWCAAFVNWCAERAAERLGVRSPLERVPLQGYVPSYVDTFPAVTLDNALPGDLFAVWSPARMRYAHIGFVRGVLGRGWNLSTVEGNTNEAGGREGDRVLSRVRDGHPSRVVVLRWTRTVGAL